MEKMRNIFVESLKVIEKEPLMNTIQVPKGGKLHVIGY